MSDAPTVLCVLDGFGYSPQVVGNAIMAAQTPTMDMLWTNFPSFLLKAAEEEVGLEFGEIGNSEVGHMTIGTGRVIPQSLNRINKAIDDGSFYQNPILLETINAVKRNNAHLHLLGIISTAGVHGHLFHYLAVLRMAAQLGLKQVYLHLITDGRDAGKFDSPLFLREIDNTRQETGVGTYASITGRGFTMDRNNNWERTKSGFDVFLGQGKATFPDPHAAIKYYYEQQIDDENIPPTLINAGNNPVKLSANDAIIFTNFREDRARQITRALIKPDFAEFNREGLPENISMTTMTEYEKGLPTQVAFPFPEITNVLSDVLSKNGLSQIHIAESEKYAHVTYFFNGGREEKVSYEEYFMVQSNPPETFASQPEMSASGVADAVIQSIDLGYNFIVLNFANCDMVGHTGDYQATVKAIEIVDQQVKRIFEKVWERNGTFFLTADHGNSEQMINPKTGEIYKKHTIAPVPLIIANQQWHSPSQGKKVMTQGQIAGLLSDIAPTILKTMGLAIPGEMTGASLVG